MNAASDSYSAPPPEWERPLAEFDRQLLGPKTPDLTRCFDGFVGDPVPVLVEALKTQQSHCRHNGLNPGKQYQALLYKNPRWQEKLQLAELDLAKSAPTNSASTAPERSRMHGRYCLTAHLGRGGLADVYLARDSQTHRFVAAKVSRQDLEPAAIDAASRALEEERNAALALPRDYRHLNRYYDYEIDAAGVPAIIYELDEAESLVNRRSHSSVVIVRRMLQICEALQTAHEHRVYHGDLKPHNILIRDKSDDAIVIDFGVSLATKRWLRERVTAQFSAVTVAYIAPELLCTDEEPNPVAVDVFGIGAVLYYQLTGRAPFQGRSSDDLRDSPRVDLIDFDLLDRAPCSPTAKRVCRTALQRIPDRRYSSPAVMRKELLRSPEGRRIQYTWVAKRVLHPRSVKVAVAVLAVASLLAGVYQAISSATRPVEPTQQPSRWMALAAENGVDPATITADDFKIKVSCRQRDLPGWQDIPESDPIKGTVIVTPSARLKNMADLLQYRFGMQKWQPMFWFDPVLQRQTTVAQRQATISERRATVYEKDLEIDGPFFVRLGGDGDFAGGILAGPFEYEVSVSKALADDLKDVLADTIAEASGRAAIVTSRRGWRMPHQFAFTYQRVIARVRFGTSPNDLRYVASYQKALSSPGQAPESSTSPSPRTGLALHEVFRDQSLPVQDAEALWVQIEFVTGEVSKVRRYHRDDSPGLRADEA